LEHPAQEEKKEIPNFKKIISTRWEGGTLGARRKQAKKKKKTTKDDGKTLARERTIGAKRGLRFGSLKRDLKKGNAISSSERKIPKKLAKKTAKKPENGDSYGTRKEK